MNGKPDQDRANDNSQAMIGRGTVVVVDPNPLAYMSFAECIVTSKPGARFLTTGRAALRQAVELSVELFVINTRLPDMSGFDLIEMLGQQFHRVPIFVVSDQYREMDERNSLRLGARRYLCKPFGPRTWRDLPAQQRNSHATRCARPDCGEFPLGPKDTRLHYADCQPSL